MRQVFQNLISNAIKYRHPDRPPLITISASTVPATRPALRTTLPILEITIADNGIGFEKRHRERIFEPFQRLHSSDDMRAAASASRSAARSSTATAAPLPPPVEPGVGAVFTIILPLPAVAAH